MTTLAAPKIQKITSKGQITLPIAWRRKVKTDMIMVRETAKGVEIIPARTFSVDPEDRDDDIIIFDANRDNNGKGIPADEFIARLKRLNRLDMRRKAKRGYGRNR